MSYPGEEDHRDYPIDPDVAEDNLDRIIGLKEELVELMDKMVSAGGDMKDALAMEDAFDDSLHKEWRRNYEAPVAITYSNEVPSCQEIRALMERERLAKKLRPVPTNPETRGDL